MTPLVAFLGLRPVDDRTWVLPVMARVCAGDGRLFGGSLVAATTVTLEQVSGLQVATTSVGFLGAVSTGDELQLTCELGRPSRGHGLVQARVAAEVAQRPVGRVEALLTPSDHSEARRWGPAPPPVPGPDRCPLRRYQLPTEGSLSSRLEIRVARTDVTGGRVVLWGRLAGVDEMSAGLVGLLSDHLAYGLRQILGEDVGVRSLDTTVQVMSLVASPWVRLDIALESFRPPIAHGRVVLWAEDGSPLATASQSLLVVEAAYPVIESQAATSS